MLERVMGSKRVFASVSDCHLAAEQVAIYLVELKCRYIVPAIDGRPVDRRIGIDALLVTR